MARFVNRKYSHNLDLTDPKTAIRSLLEECEANGGEDPATSQLLEYAIADRKVQVFEIKTLFDLMARSFSGQEDRLFEWFDWFLEAKAKEQEAVWFEAKEHFDKCGSVMEWTGVRERRPDGAIKKTGPIRLAVIDQMRLGRNCDGFVPYARAKKGLGATIVVIRTTGGNVQIFGRRRRTNLDRLIYMLNVEELRELERSINPKDLQAEKCPGSPWYYLKQGLMILNGSRTTDAPATKLTLSKVVALVKEAYPRVPDQGPIKPPKSA